MLPPVVSTSSTINTGPVVMNGVSAAAMRSPPLQAFIIRDHGATDLATGPDADRHTNLHRRSLDIQLWFDPHQT